MSIRLKQPYKIIPAKHKQYEGHYWIPAADVIVIPIKKLGDEVSCDIRWEDKIGGLQVVHNAMFVNENLVPIDTSLDADSLRIWSLYY